MRKFEGTCFIPGDQLATMAKYYRGANLNLNLTLFEDEFSRGQQVNNLCPCSNFDGTDRMKFRGFDDNTFDQYSGIRSSNNYHYMPDGDVDSFPAVEYPMERVDKSTNTSVIPARSDKLGNTTRTKRKLNVKRGKEEYQESIASEASEYDKVAVRKSPEHNGPPSHEASKADLKCSVCEKDICSVCRSPKVKCCCAPIPNPITCSCCQSKMAVTQPNAKAGHSKNLTDLLLLLIGARMSKQTASDSCRCPSEARAVSDTSSECTCPQEKKVRKIYLYDYLSDAERSQKPQGGGSEFNDSPSSGEDDFQHDSKKLPNCMCCCCGEKHASKGEGEKQSVDHRIDSKFNAIESQGKKIPKEERKIDRSQELAQKMGAIENIMVCLPKIQSTLEELVGKLGDIESNESLGQNQNTSAGLSSVLQSMTLLKLLAAQFRYNDHNGGPIKSESQVLPDMETREEVSRGKEGMTSVGSICADALADNAQPSQLIPEGTDKNYIDIPSTVLELLKSRYCVNSDSQTNANAEGNSDSSSIDTGFVQTELERDEMLARNASSSEVVDPGPSAAFGATGANLKLTDSVPLPEITPSSDSDSLRIPSNSGTAADNRGAISSIHRMIQKVNETIAQIDSTTSMEMGDSSRDILRPEDRERLSFFVRLDDEAKPALKPTSNSTPISRPKINIRSVNNAMALKNKASLKKNDAGNKIDQMSTDRKLALSERAYKKPPATPASKVRPPSQSKTGSLIPRRTRDCNVKEEKTLPDNENKALINELLSSDPSTIDAAPNQNLATSKD